MDFNTVWEEHKTHLFNFIRAKVSDKASSEDILQEVGLKFHTNFVRKSDIKNPKTWLFQVARNTIADHFRACRKDLQPLDSVGLSGLKSESYVPCVCDITGFVIREYLPDSYGVPLFLSDIEQLPQIEIAKVLNLKLSTTKSRIQRGRKKLKELASKCVDINYNQKGQIVDFQLKNNCELPSELKHEMVRLNLIL